MNRHYKGTKTKQLLDIYLKGFSKHLKTRSQDNRKEIWDPVRKKYVVLSPEEFTRQLLIQFLKLDLGVGFGRMLVEKRSEKSGIRFDLAVMRPNGCISLAAECKSFLVDLSDHTSFQLAKYNRKLDSKYALITNGRQTYIWENKKDACFINNIENLKHVL